MSKLRAHLLAHGLTMTRFAALIGSTHATVSRICAGKVGISFGMARRIVEATGGEVGFDDLAPLTGASRGRNDAVSRTEAA